MSQEVTALGLLQMPGMSLPSVTPRDGNVYVRQTELLKWTVERWVVQHVDYDRFSVESRKDGERLATGIASKLSVSAFLLNRDGDIAPLK